MKKISHIICLLICMSCVSVWAQEANNESDEEASEQAASQQEVKEKKYVTDKLRLSLYKKADSNSGTLKLLISGDVLDVLERAGPYSKVRTVGGVTGWVKNGFLVSIPTASFLLIEEQKKNEKLTSQLDKFSNTQKIIDDYENTIRSMSTDNESTQQELDTIKGDFDQLSELNIDLKEEIEFFTQSDNQLSFKELKNIIQKYWIFLLASLLILFFIGYLIGKETVEARVRKRFQGVKVL